MVFSLEMSKEQLVNRMLAMESNVDSQKLRTGNLTDSDWDAVVEGIGVIGNSKLIIDDTPGISIIGAAFQVPEDEAGIWTERGNHRLPAVHEQAAAARAEAITVSRRSPRFPVP